jgi:hypothetical protein
MQSTTKQTATQVIEEAPSQGFFELTFSNSKRHGLRPIQTHHCQGALYTSGHVHIDTQELRRTYFETLGKMCEYLDEFGYYRVNWEEPA